MVDIATLWTTSDALRAIEDVQTLMVHPGDRPVLANLAKEESELASDRAEALRQEAAAERALSTHLPPVDLPAISSGTSSAAG